MNQKAWNQELVYFIFIVLVGIASRLVPHPWNFTAIGAMAIFSGFAFKSKLVLRLAPLLSLFLTDLVLGFHSTMLWTYLGFSALMIASAVFAKQAKEFPMKSKLGGVAGLSVGGSLLFFFLTNTGVWVESSFYSKDLGGLLASLLAGVPFLFNQMAGDLFYSCVFGLAYKVLIIQETFQKRVPSSSL